MARLRTLDAQAAIECAANLIKQCQGAETMEAAAQRAATVIRAALEDDNGSPACPLVRVYKTHPFKSLPPDLQQFATSVAIEKDFIGPDTLCLTLLGTAGAETVWNHRRHSRSHQAIPLSSASAITRLPMVAHLMRDLGLDMAALTDSEAALDTTVAGGRLGIFHVGHAEGSISIPAQEEFVDWYGIKSAFGAGAVLGPRDVTALVAFSTVRVSPAVAEHLGALAEGMTQVFRPLVDRVFG